MDLYLFNPDTDLAQGMPSYTPARGVASMIRDLALLPALLTGCGDLVLTDGETEAYKPGAALLMRTLGLDFRVVSSLDERTWNGIRRICPWGWNPSIRHRLEALGAPEGLLPPAGNLERLRRLCSREGLERMSEGFGDMEGVRARSVNLIRPADVAALLDSGTEWVLKAPFSSSGKGLLWPRVLGRELTLSRAAHVIRTQGLITAMPRYERVADFAMEFQKDARKVTFLGFSLFSTTSRGAYQGNLCLGDDLAESFLLRWVPAGRLLAVRERLMEMLRGLDYEGPLGVDMMVARGGDGSHFLVPLVEMNLRMNMGILAHGIRERFLGPDSAALLRILHFSSSQALEDFARKKEQDAPLKADSGRILSGFLPLSPLDSSTRSLAFLEVAPVRDLIGLWPSLLSI